MIRQKRAAWGARPPKNRRRDVAPSGVAIHYPGAAVAYRAQSHDQHLANLRGWQDMHMARGSNDIEYGSFICPCGIWIEGRTEWDDPMVRVGSNGTGDANYRYTSVQLMLGTGERIDAAMIAAAGEAVAQLRAWGWGYALLGHRDLYATACPGDSIYAALPAIADAAAHPQPPASNPDDDADDEGEDMFIIRKKGGSALLIIGGTREHVIHDAKDIEEMAVDGVPVFDLTEKTFESIRKGRT